MDHSAGCSVEQLATDSKGGGSVLGGSSMEYNQEAGPTKYLVGTEQGVIMQVNR
jgi:dynein intermediate chain 2, axonemal